MKINIHLRLAALALILAATALADEANWPQFRGPGSRGLPAESARPPAEWSAARNIAWQTEVAGLGWSSPVVWAGKIFITSVARVAGDEPAQMGLYLGKSRGEGDHRFLVMCFESGSGRLLWEREVHRGVPARAIHLKNSFASATAVTDGQRVVALFHDLGLFAFDLDGKPLWRLPVKATKTRSDFGHGGSPVLHAGRVYLVDDNEDESYAAAYDAATGKEVWRLARDRETNYTTPLVWTETEPAQLIVPATKRTIAYDLDGKEIWSFTGGFSKLTIATPFTAHGLLYVSSGYFQDPVRGLFVIKPGARGDITLRNGATSSAAIAWSDPKIAPYNPTPLVFGQELYILYDQGMLSCYDALTGRAHYEKIRLTPPAGGLAGGFTASPWAHDGKIFCLSERAETFVVKAGPQFALLGCNSLDPEPCLATPALVGDALILRTASRLYSIRQAQVPAR
jgi:outer membrane protein assembly factor BamB